MGAGPGDPSNNTVPITNLINALFIRLADTFCLPLRRLIMTGLKTQMSAGFNVPAALQPGYPTMVLPKAIIALV